MDWIRGKESPYLQSLNKRLETGGRHKEARRLIID
jgi:hypothetical protein